MEKGKVTLNVKFDGMGPESLFALKPKTWRAGSGQCGTVLHWRAGHYIPEGAGVAPQPQEADRE